MPPLDIAYTWTDLEKVGMPWLLDKIASQNCFSSLSGEQYQEWIEWVILHGFAYLYPNPPTLGLIARPVSMYQVEHYMQWSQLELLYLFDPAGEILWMDFLWAPGQYGQLMKFLKATGKKWGGWEHRKTQRPHFVEIEKLVSRS
jgi:hypothetical protein